MSSNTNKTQFRHLIGWMCEHPEIGRGIPRGGLLPQPHTKIMLEELFSELNGLGPPEKTEFMWRKVWADFRHSTKKKFREHYSNQRKHNFSELENRVVELLQLKKQFDMNEREFNNLLKKKYKKRKMSRKSLEKEHNDDSNNYTQDETEINTPKSEENSPNVFKFINAADETSEETTSPFIDTARIEEINMPEQKLTYKYERKCKTEKSNSSEQSMLSVMQKIEQHMRHLNQTEEHNNALLEENNRLLKVLVYRTTIAPFHNDNNKLYE